jgi:GTP:adenosylcobinamide-phosphate guanylyltransferase
VLIVPADLPLINSLDIESIIEMGENPPVVVISPDRHRRGTNALLVSPPNLLQYQFGEDSFQKHSNQALQVGARLEICDRPALALDLDLPEDLMLVRRQMQMLDALMVDGLPGAGGKMEMDTDEFVKSNHGDCIDRLESISQGEQDA